MARALGGPKTATCVHLEVSCGPARGGVHGSHWKRASGKEMAVAWGIRVMPRNSPGRAAVAGTRWVYPPLLFPCHHSRHEVWPRLCIPMLPTCEVDGSFPGNRLSGKKLVMRTEKKKNADFPTSFPEALLEAKVGLVGANRSREKQRNVCLTGRVELKPSPSARSVGTHS